MAEPPFRSCIDPRRFYHSPTHEEALARLHFLIEHRRRLGLLLGPAGSGKSLVLEVFAGQMRDTGRPTVTLNLMGLEPTEFLLLLATGLGLNPSPASSTPLLWRCLSDRITEYRYQQLDTLLLLDDADCAGRGVLAHLTRLANWDSGPDSRLTMVLAGQESRMGRLGAGLLDLAELRIDLEPWEPADTADFIQTSLRQAGRAAPLFAQPAIARLHELAQGIPRRVRQLADLALVAGAGRKLDTIDAQTVETACQELGTVEVKREG